jgi:hypothetical protein
MDPSPAVLPISEFHRWAVGSATWGWWQRGDLPPEQIPAFLLKVGNGKTHSKAIGPSPRLDLRSAVRTVDGLGLVLLLVRVGSYPATFPVVVNHYSLERRSPLPALAAGCELGLHFYEEQSVLPVQTSVLLANHETLALWANLLRAVEILPPWSEAAFAAALTKLEESPDRLFEELSTRSLPQREKP